jgi:tetratricopeptide (TPR) repeat protein
MSHFLKAMGFWIWGLIAIGLSVTIVSVNSRVLSLFRAHDLSVTSSEFSSTEADHPISRVSRSAAPAAQSQGPKISRILAKEMTAAQKALQAHQWAEALDNLRDLEAKSGLTPFDKKTIYYFRGFANVKLGNLKAAQVDYQKALATGAENADEKTIFTRTLFAISTSTNQFQETINYGKEMADDGTATPADLAIIAQSYYQLKDCHNSGVWVDKAVAASREAGEAPKENLFLFKLQCASDASDNAAMVPVLHELIRVNNKSTYWNILLRIERQDERDDRNLLMLYRLMYATRSMNADTDYIEMAQLLGDAALPGEAKAVLEKAMHSGMVKDEHRERVARMLEALTARVEADPTGWTRFDQTSRESTTGDSGVMLGETKYATGDYPGAIAAISAGLEKGQVKHLDDAYVYLGLSQAALRDDVAAEEAFDRLKTVPGISRRLVSLWQLYAEAPR